MQNRSKLRQQSEGKTVPEEAVLDMKANFSLPQESDGLFDKIEFVELQRDQAQQLVDWYNK